MKYILAIISSILLLSGCAVNQSIDLNYTPQQAAQSNGITIETSVTDNRISVRSGNKKPTYLGQYRALLGIPWNVKNFESVPLAEQIASDLKAELSAQGYTNTSSNPDLLLTVSINEWNFISYRNGNFWYDLHVTLKNSKGQTLQSFSVDGLKYLKASGGLGGSKRAFEKDLPLIYQRIINSIVNNPTHPIPH